MGEKEKNTEWYFRKSCKAFYCMLILPPSIMGSFYLRGTAAWHYGTYGYLGIQAVTRHAPITGFAEKVVGFVTFRFLKRPKKYFR